MLIIQYISLLFVITQIKKPNHLPGLYPRKDLRNKMQASQPLLLLRIPEKLCAQINYNPTPEVLFGEEI